jgi:hypothetical protein
VRAYLLVRTETAIDQLDVDAAVQLGLGAVGYLKQLLLRDLWIRQCPTNFISMLSRVMMGTE